MKRTLAFLAVIFMFTAESVFAGGLSHIQGQGELTFALTGQYPPFNFVDSNGELTGFDVEVGKEIGKRLSVTGKPVATAWDGIIAGLLADKYDLIIGSMAITAARLKSIDFSEPYYRSGAQLFSKKGASYSNISEFDGKKIGVTLGTTYEKWLRKNAPKVDVKTYKGVPDMMLEVMNGRIDGFLTDKIVGLIAIKNKKMPIQLVGDVVYPELIGIAIQKGNPALVKAINGALMNMKKDGTYKSISMKWVGADIR